MGVDARRLCSVGCQHRPRSESPRPRLGGQRDGLGEVKRRTWATSPERKIQYLTTLHVDESTTFWVSSGHPSRRTVGLIAGIAGPMAMVSGIVLALSQLLNDPAYQCNERNCPPSKSHPVGPALFLTGLFVTPFGWELFATSGPRVHPVDDEPHKGMRDQRLQLGVLALLRGGWGVGLSTPF
jgi:hypothetical protein